MLMEGMRPQMCRQRHLPGARGPTTPGCQVQDRTHVQQLMQGCEQPMRI